MLIMAYPLKRLRMGGKEYFIDERLSEIRNVRDPNDAESVSPELIDFWMNHCEQKGNFMVCDLKNIRLRQKIFRNVMRKPFDLKYRKIIAERDD